MIKRETGIIMSGSHPLDILEERKTMTRRLWGLKEINEHPDAWEHFGFDQAGRFSFRWIGGDRIVNVKCPYGGVGDRLWIRESYATRADGVHQILYRADYNAISDMLDLQDFCERWGYPQISIAWKPSIHMFRKDSRGTLDITALRPERLQQITPADCIAEGSYMATDKDDEGGFVNLWDSLNGKKYPWVSNPWVWVIGFGIIKQ